MFVVSKITLLQIIGTRDIFFDLYTSTSEVGKLRPLNKTLPKKHKKFLRLYSSETTNC